MQVDSYLAVFCVPVLAFSILHLYMSSINNLLAYTVILLSVELFTLSLAVQGSGIYDAFVPSLLTPCKSSSACSLFQHRPCLFSGIWYKKAV